MAITVQELRKGNVVREEDGEIRANRLFQAFDESTAFLEASETIAAVNARPDIGTFSGYSNLVKVGVGIVERRNENFHVLEVIYKQVDAEWELRIGSNLVDVPVVIGTAVDDAFEYRRDSLTTERGTSEAILDTEVSSILSTNIEYIEEQVGEQHRILGDEEWVYQGATIRSNGVRRTLRHSWKRRAAMPAFDFSRDDAGQDLNLGSNVQVVQVPELTANQEYAVVIEETEPGKFRDRVVAKTLAKDENINGHNQLPGWSAFS